MGYRVARRRSRINGSLDLVSCVLVVVFEQVEDWQDLSVVWHQGLSDGLGAHDQLLDDAPVDEAEAQDDAPVDEAEAEVEETPRKEDWDEPHDVQEITVS